MNKLEKFLTDYEAKVKFERQLDIAGYDSIDEYWMAITVGNIEPQAILGAIEYYSINSQEKQYWSNLDANWINYLKKN